MDNITCELFECVNNNGSGGCQVLPELTLSIDEGFACSELLISVEASLEADEDWGNFPD